MVSGQLDSSIAGLQINVLLERLFYTSSSSRYRKFPVINPGHTQLYFKGLSGGFSFGRAYFWKEFYFKNGWICI